MPGKTAKEDEDEVIGVRAAARLVGVHENTIRNWAKAGKLESAQMSTPGRTRKFSKLAIQRIAITLPDPPPRDRTEAYQHGYRAGWRDALDAISQSMSKYREPTKWTQ